MSNDANVFINLPQTHNWQYNIKELDPHSPIAKAINNEVLFVNPGTRWGAPPVIALTDKAKEWMELTGLHGRFLGGKTRAIICFDDYYAAGLFRLAFEL